MAKLPILAEELFPCVRRTINLTQERRHRDKQLSAPDAAYYKAQLDCAADDEDIRVTADAWLAAAKQLKRFAKYRAHIMRRIIKTPRDVKRVAIKKMKGSAMAEMVCSWFPDLDVDVDPETKCVTIEWD